MELKERIILNASDAFMRCGIKNITMDEIASRMGISKRTIYENFKDKDSLLIECVKNWLKMHRQMALTVIEESENVLEVILKIQKMNMEEQKGMHRRYFDDMKKYHPNAWQLLEDGRKESYKNTISFLQKGVEQGVFRADINFEVVAVWIYDQMDWFIKKDFGNQYSFYDLYQSIVSILMRGISTMKGLDILEKYIREKE